jgi:hypothetical protein
MAIGEDGTLRYTPSEQDPKWSGFMTAPDSKGGKDGRRGKKTAKANPETDSDSTRSSSSEKQGEAVPSPSYPSEGNTSDSQFRPEKEPGSGSETGSEKAERKTRGRPKGSKNKKTLEREARQRAEGAEQVKRGRGRPKGAKNKKTLEREAKLMAEGLLPRPKRKPGRPKGSKNKTRETKPLRALT